MTDEDRAEVAQTRAEAAAEAAVEPRETIAEVRDVDAAGVRCRFYAPTTPRGLLLYFHGGGFVYGDLDTHDAHCRRTVNRSGWAVLAVHYRRAPEHPFPAAVDDATAVGDWVASRRGDLVDDVPHVVAGTPPAPTWRSPWRWRHPDAFAGQLLVYPFLDPSCDTYDREIPDADFPVEALAWFWRMYLQRRRVATTSAPTRSCAPSYAGLPPALVQLAALDVLTPTGRQLADRMAGDEVPVDVVVYPGVGHGFWRHDDNDQHDPAQRDVAAFLARLA